ncbi:MAG: adenylyltransferase/cytidyltransferase family protein [Thermoplasmata archaeon]|nr:adenylyltransferase/cytidyltransferase family protein [Thermoplasmata archaeon]
MVRVMATGVFDILHLGHLHFLEEARKLGDELVVVVATDKTAERGKHLPIITQEMRVELVGALEVVDKVYLGHEGDPFRIVEELRPDIIALGFDQFHDEVRIKAELRKRGLDHIKVVRLPKFDHDLNGTRKIIKKILEGSSRFRTIK